MLRRGKILKMTLLSVWQSETSTGRQRARGPRFRVKARLVV